jgi:hypothetical protein
VIRGGSAGGLTTLCALSLSQDTCVARTETAFLKWGRWSLLLGRFVPGVSLVAPPLAGALGMRWPAFLGLTTAGGLLYGTALVGAGGSPMTEASLVKDLGTELEQFMPIAIADAIATARESAAGDAATVPPELLRTLAYITQFAPTFSLRGGTREVLRGLIARGLGLR